VNWGWRQNGSYSWGDKKVLSININGVKHSYEIMGENGPTVVVRSGGWLGMEIISKEVNLLKRHARILAYDYRNCGDSGVLLEESESEFPLLVHDLHVLLEKLKMRPVYLAGSSLGAIFSLLYAATYPSEVKGIGLFNLPTDDISLAENLAWLRYRQFAEEATHNGMSGVVRLAEGLFQPDKALTVTNPIVKAILRDEGRKQLSESNPHEFSAIMNRWANTFVSDRLWSAWLSDEDLRQIKTPVLIVPGLEKTHPIHTAERLHKQLINSEYVEPEALVSFLIDAGVENPKENGYSLYSTPEVMSYFVAFFETIEAGT
jgi:pimeloyl-ACP methyl ester carboxylesterase